jgi:hypothetical protein
MTFKKVTAALCVALGSLTFSGTASADCDGCVVGAVQAAGSAITGSLTAVGAAITTILDEIDNDIAAIGAKEAGSTTMASNMQREMAAQTGQQHEINTTLQQTELPIDPCSTSGSNYAMQAMHAAHQTASSYRPGGNAPTANPTLQKILNNPAPPVESSRRASTGVHESNYCSTNEVQLGYPGCVTSAMPDADADADSLYTGAGMPGKDADLTYTQQQLDAARAYERMSLDPEPPQMLNKAAANTESGKLYIAMQKAYEANISSGQSTMNKIIANHAPFPGSAQLIADINQSSDAAQQYYNANASPVAKSTGSMSLTELESFEAGRRWQNPYWQIEMGAVADPTKLQREQVFTLAFMSQMLFQSYERQEHMEVLLGQILAELTRANERGPLESQLLRVHAAS